MEESKLKLIEVEKVKRNRNNMHKYNFYICIVATIFSVLFTLPFNLFAVPTINSITKNTDPVDKYEKFELVVDLTASYANPYNPDEVKLWAVFTSPTNVIWTINGFYSGSEWKIRFGANETGVWNYVVKVWDASGTSESSSNSFTCNSSSYHGWLRIASNKRYLMHDDNTTFYGIGHDRCWNSTTTPFSTLYSYGMNMITIWLGVWDSIENTSTGIGKYDQTKCTTYDNYITSAEQNGIHISLVVWFHDVLRIPGEPWPGGTWSSNAYSTITTPEDFYRSSSTTPGTPWSYQQKLYRYIIARWGYSRALGIWDIISEIDGTTGYSRDSTAGDQWSERVHQYFKTNDPFKHLTSGSKSGDAWWPVGYSIFDIAEMHSYVSANDAVGVATTVAAWTRQMWSGFTKPNILGEFGTNNQALQPQHIHNGIWAGLAAGASITPLDWNDGGSWGDMTTPMLEQMKYYSDFVKGIDFVGIIFTPATVTVSGCNAWGMKSGNSGFAWVQNTSGNVSGKSFTFSGLVDGNYPVEWYDCWTGQVVSAQNVNSSGGTLTTTIPTLSRNDIACKIGTIDDTTPPTGTPITPTDAGASSPSTTIVFNWTLGTSADAESGIAGYYLQVGTTPGGNDKFDGDVENVLTSTITGCANGSTYYARVRARNGAGLYSSYSGNSDGILIKVALEISPSAFPPVLEGVNGFAGVLSQWPLQVNGGTAPYTWSIIGGSLPEGVSLDASTGLISGRPLEFGLFPFTVKVVDQNLSEATKDLSLKINLLGDADGDGLVSINELQIVINSYLGVFPLVE